MSSFSIREFEGSNSTASLEGKPRWAVLVDHQGCPFFWPNVFVTIYWVKAGKSINSIKAVLRTLGMFYQWADARGIDLDELLINGTFINVDQATDLAQFIGLNMASMDKELEIAQKPKNKKIISLEQVRGGFKDTKAVEAQYTTAEQKATRMRWIIKFLDFMMLKRKGNDHKIEKAAQIAIDAFKTLIPRVSTKVNDEARLGGMSKEEVEITEAAFRPESETNPFRSGYLQHRNYVMWRIFYEAGLRRDELRNIKTSDLNLPQRQILVRVSKTRPRTVPISSETANTIHHFVIEHWSKLPKSKKAHSYLFTTEKGDWMSNDGISLVIRTVREKVDGIPDWFATHTNRRTFNDNLSARFDALPEGHEGKGAEKQIRSRLNGWSDNSHMGERYAKRHIARAADKVAEELVGDLVKGADQQSTDEKK